MNYNDIHYADLLPDGILFSFIEQPCKVCGNNTHTYDQDYSIPVCSDECYLSFLEGEIEEVIDLVDNEP